MILIIDNTGNVIPCANIEWGGGAMYVRHRGNNVWRVGHFQTASQAPTVTRWLSHSRDKWETQTRALTQTVTRATDVTRRPWRTVTRERTVTRGAFKWVTMQTVSHGVNVVTRWVTNALTVTQCTLTRDVTASYTMPRDRCTVTKQFTATAWITRDVSVDIPCWQHVGDTFNRAALDWQWATGGTSPPFISGSTHVRVAYNGNPTGDGNMNFGERMCGEHYEIQMRIGQFMASAASQVILYMRKNGTNLYWAIYRSNGTREIKKMLLGIPTTVATGGGAAAGITMCYKRGPEGANNHDLYHAASHLYGTDDDVHDSTKPEISANWWSATTGADYISMDNFDVATF